MSTDEETSYMEDPRSTKSPRIWESLKETTLEFYCMLLHEQQFQWLLNARPVFKNFDVYLSQARQFHSNKKPTITQLPGWVTVSGLVFTNSVWMLIGQSTIQPSATQLDGLCHMLADLQADRCSFCERNREQKGEMGRREETLVWGQKISTVFSSLCLLFYFPQQWGISAPPRCSLSSRASTSNVCKTGVLAFFERFDEKQEPVLETCT